MSTNTEKADIIILGAGASGLMCASLASSKGQTVTVLDSGPRPARKVLVSGGGKCNYTNLNADASHYISSNPSFTRSALARFSPDNALEFLDAHNIKYEVREQCRVFLIKSAAQVADALVNDCQKAGGKIVLKADIASVSQAGDGFTVKTSKGEFQSKQLVIATGGKSWKGIGATGLGYQLARQFGHEVTELRPGLVPMVLGASGNPFKGLSGISFTCEVTEVKSGRAFTDEVLITHRGISGPAVLQASSHFQNGGLLKLNILPGEDTEDVLGWLTENRSRKTELKNLLAERLPKRLAYALSENSGGSAPMNSYADKTLSHIAGMLNSMELRPSATEGFPNAEVTVGGVDTRRVSSKTMESLITPGLYITGEVLDVTGELGGYNLHWAWASAHAAGIALSGVLSGA